tara:strand:+ start:323 stop:643 length:321 start_codon:yes stop_codon:yes gene_type:complete
MPYQTLDNISDLGIREVLNFPNLNTPIFYPIFLFVVFFVFTSLSFFREVGREGKGNFLSSLAVGGYAATAVAAILSLMDLIQTAVLVTTLVSALVFQVLFLLTKRQ